MVHDACCTKMTFSLVALYCPWAAQRKYLVYFEYSRILLDRGGGGVLSTPLVSTFLCTSCQWSGGISRNKISLANFLKRFYSQIWDEGGFFSQSSKTTSSHCYLQPLDPQYLYFHSERSTTPYTRRPVLDYWASSCAGAPGVWCEYGSVRWPLDTFEQLNSARWNGSQHPELLYPVVHAE